MESRYKAENGELLTVRGILSMSQNELRKHDLKLVLCGHVANEEGQCTCLGGGKKLFVMIPQSAVLFGVRAPTTFVQAVRFDIAHTDRKTEWIPQAVACCLKPTQQSIKMVTDLFARLKSGQIPDFNEFRDLPRLLNAC